MHWAAFILLTVALSVYAPFAGDTSCAEPSCCAQMAACCGDCHCPAQQSCSVAKPVALDLQAPVKLVQVSPRISVALFALPSLETVSLASDRLIRSRPETPPPEPPPSPQARLCLWLI